MSVCLPHVDGRATTATLTRGKQLWECVALDEGLVFRRHYVQVAVCGPSRSSLLTGRRPDSTNINAAAPNSWCWCQRGEFMTLPHYFKNNGYVTGGAGKIFHPVSPSISSRPVVHTCLRRLNRAADGGRTRAT